MRKHNTPQLRERASTVTRRDDHILLIQLRDPLSGIERLFPPGGGIEPNETPDQTAERETFEETGYRVKLLSNPPVILAYDFNWGGTLYRCRTHFYPAEIVKNSPEPITFDAIQTGVEWVRFSDLPRALAHHAGIRDTVIRLAKKSP